MAFEHRLNSGTLFKNDRKTSDKHPDFKGEGNVAGVGKVDIAAWKRKGPKAEFLSLAIKPKNAGPTTPQKPAAPEGMPF